LKKRSKKLLFVGLSLAIDVRLLVRSLGSILRAYRACRNIQSKQES
jgi:hypothetical protein